MGDPKWYPLYEKVLKAGKSLQLGGTSVEEIRALIARFGQKGFFFSTGASTEEKAREILAEFGRE
jgi:hypothetical protein